MLLPPEKTRHLRAGLRSRQSNLLWIPITVFSGVIAWKLVSAFQSGLDTSVAFQRVSVFEWLATVLMLGAMAGRTWAMRHGDHLDPNPSGDS